MGKTIVLIDDSKVMRSILRKSILMCNYQVEEFIEADNGEDGYSIVSGTKPFDIAFVDLHMPKLGGVDMLRRLHEGGGAKSPIVVVSTSGDQETQKMCLELGAVGFVRKPFTPNDIGEIMGRVIGKSNA
ncbi:MAG: response regulator [Deltaproteobacteria bacterium]|nr:response regulator [Deltaproteobacteria bacterium]